MSNELEIEIEGLAFEMVKKTYPDELKEEFELHIKSAYSAPEYFEILLHLSELIFAIGSGVLANIAFKNIVPSDQATKKDIQSLVSRYESTIEELRGRLEEQQLVKLDPLTNESKFEFKDCTSIEDDEISLCVYHEKMLAELKENDHEIIFAVNEAIEQLNARNQE